MIWFSIIIPIIAVIILTIFFNKKIVWWEYICCIAIPLITIIIAKQASIYSQTVDTEIFNNFVVKAEYYEDWNEYIHRTCTESYACGTDSKGNTQYCTRTYDCSYVDYHSEYYQITDNSGNIFSITKEKFYWICDKFKNKTFKDLHRNYHTDDGDMYFSDFNGYIIPLTTQHTYENKVQCSKSVFNFPDPDTSKYKLFNYPNITLFNYNPILGYDNKDASLLLAQKNAEYGIRKKVHMLLLVFKNKPYEIAIQQQNYWKNGNKNEFIVCVGINDSIISWTKVISWTDNHLLKVKTERLINELKKFDIIKVINIMSNEVEQGFIKKSFKDFNYITVEPTNTAVKVTYILVFLITISWSIFSIVNIHIKD